MKKQPDKGKITALYERLSHDDERAGESVSIENQKRILEDYAQKNGFTNIRHFTDDGVRGTTFKRPGLDAMLEEIRAGKCGYGHYQRPKQDWAVMLSKWGLLKRTFDEYHVRFIAANDNLDTANGFDIMSIFRDVINEWYVADTSRKIKTVFKSRMEKGLRCSGSVSYGYLASKEKQGRMGNRRGSRRRCAPYLPQRCCRGEYRQHSKGTPRRENPYPVRALEADRRTRPVGKVHRPLRMVNNNYQLYPQTPGVHRAQGFRENRLRELQDQKHPQDRAGGNSIFLTGKSPPLWTRKHGTPSSGLWEQNAAPPSGRTPPNRLTGLLYCADCGAKLTHRSSLVQGKYLDDAFVCSSYRQLTRDCTMHYIPTAKMEAAISCRNPARELVCTAQ